MKTNPPKAFKSRFLTKRVSTILLGVFLIFLMVGSMLIMSTSTDEKYDYHGLTFTQTQEGWLAYKDNQKILIFSNPADLEDIEIPNIDISTFNSKSKTYLSFNPSESLGYGVYEFAKNIRITSPIVKACTDDVLGCEDLPLKICDDSSDDVGVVMFEESEQSSIEVNDNCLVIKGKNQDLVNLVDKLVLQVYGI